MSLVDYLFTNRTPMELAKELARSAHENAALRDKLGAAELELFWMKAAEREPAAQASAPTDIATVQRDAAESAVSSRLASLGLGMAVQASTSLDPVAETLMRAGETREDAIRMAAVARATVAAEEAQASAAPDARPRPPKAMTNAEIRTVMHYYSRMHQPGHYSDTEFDCLQDVIGFVRYCIEFTLTNPGAEDITIDAARLAATESNKGE